MSADLPKRKPGRPRNKQTDNNILESARMLMMEFGLQNFSMDALAVRAGVSKPTIYRRWPTKEDLISDAFGFTAEQTDIPDTGDAWTDLHVLLTNMLSAISNRFGNLSSGANKMMAGMIDSQQLIAEYTENFITPRRQAYMKIIQRGKLRGDIREATDEEHLIDLISGAYFYCLLFRPEAVASEQWLHNVLSILKNGAVKSP
ncbi:TetR/AcrR family transcriptional regulator [Paenibacillus sp. YAF4_2]|uniref:TetR/AcrR family transcriptional regulator n=1 Tax=Paenibacillus sp. YAF4_2 TaxID=3233085 RepID=UPI003F9E0855